MLDTQLGEDGGGASLPSGPTPRLVGRGAAQQQQKGIGCTGAGGRWRAHVRALSNKKKAALQLQRLGGRDEKAWPPAACWACVRMCCVMSAATQPTYYRYHPPPSSRNVWRTPPSGTVGPPPRCTHQPTEKWSREWAMVVRGINFWEGLYHEREGRFTNPFCVDGTNEKLRPESTDLLDFLLKTVTKRQLITYPPEATAGSAVQMTTTALLLPASANAGGGRGA